MAYRQGYYKGVRFYAESHELTTGRRIATAEYPLRDEADHDDLGQKFRRFTLDLMVISSTIAWRDELLASLNEGGVGELQHPWFSQVLLVRVDNVRMREQIREQRKTTFTVDFIEDKIPTPNVGVDIPATVINVAVDELESVAVSAFVTDFSVNGPVDLIARADLDIKNALNVINNIASRLNSANVLTSRLSALGNSITSLVLSPANLALQLLSAVHTITDSNFNPAIALRNQLTLVRQSAATINTKISTLTSRQAATNANAVNMLLKTTALAEAVRLFSGEVQRDAVVESATAGVGVTFNTNTEAKAICDVLLELIDEVQIEASDTVYQQLVNVQAAIVTQFDAIAPSATLDQVAVTHTLPALVLAHRLYADATTADDLISRNHLVHPLFVSAGTLLEVRRG